MGDGEGFEVRGYRCWLDCRSSAEAGWCGLAAGRLVRRMYLTVQASKETAAIVILLLTGKKIGTRKASPV